MRLQPEIAAAVALLVGVACAWSYRDRRGARRAALALAAWGALALATGAAAVSAVVVVGLSALRVALGAAARRRRDRRDELAPLRRGMELLAAGGAARRCCTAALRDGEIALEHLQRLSFSSPEERVLLGGSLGSLLELGRKLDEIDASLVRASAVDLRPTLRDQDVLEEALAGREGADGEWFERVAAKRREVLDALSEGAERMRGIRDKAVWMTARQDEAGVDDEVELIDPHRALADVREASALVSALAEGVGEVHLGPTTRL